MKAFQILWTKLHTRCEVIEISAKHKKKKHIPDQHVLQQSLETVKRQGVS